jgi:hypothetical protein
MSHVRTLVFAMLSVVSVCTLAAEPQHPKAAINLTPGAEPPSPEVIAALAEKDLQLFDAVFNCKPALLKTLIADDFEFFHDKHGLVDTSGAQFLKDAADGCARQEAGENFRARRELVPGTMTVHLLNKFGAMQMGTHRFFALQDGKPDRLTETGKFIDLWKLDNGTWKLARVISFDHVLAPQPAE